MKKFVQKSLQKLLGFRRYLFWFSWFKIKTLSWDRKEGDFNHFLSLIPKDGKVLDIGANIGIMAVPLAKHCKQGEVHAIDPIPENFDALSRITGHFKLKNIHLYDFALGEKPGELEMVMPEVKGVQMQGLSHVVHDSIEDFNEGRRFKVPVHRLDDLDFVQDVKAIKIDVENFEYFVFKGAEATLRRYKPMIYCELWANENRDKCFELLRDELGYSIQVLSGGKLVPFNPETHENQNFFFI
ncbi:MAG: FkbM family methyltransferase [Bacteroidota bacterium]